ncbi:MAG: response regulator [Bacteroidales bacterium]|nr:response regulator [Bacteroidales bacterium]
MEKNLNILIIEDNTGDIILLQEYLNSNKLGEFSIFIANTLSQAKNRIKENNLDVILLDLNLPDSNGLQTFIEIEKIANETAIIILTEIDNNEIAVDAVNMGAQDFILKSNISDCFLNKSIKYSYNRQQLQNKANHFSRINKAIRNVNQLIIKEENSNSLLEKVTKCLVDTNGYHFVWIYLFEEKKNYYISINKEYHDLAAKFTKSVIDKHFTYCLNKTIKNNQLYVSSEEKENCIICPFYIEKKKEKTFIKTINYKKEQFGFIGVGLKEKYSIESAEQQMFREVVDDIAYALYSIKQKKQKEEYQQKLIEDEQHFCSLLNNPVNYAIYRLKAGKTPLEASITHVSPSITDIAGIKKDDIYNFNSWFYNIHPNDLDKIIAANEKGTKPPFEFDEFFKINHPTKGLRWLNIQSKGFSSEDNPNKILYANGIITDITEIKNAEIKVKQQNQEYQSLLEEFKWQNERLHELNAKTKKLLANNIIQKQEIQKNNIRLQALADIHLYKPDNIQDLLVFSLEQAIKITDSKTGYFYHYNEKKQLFIINPWSKNATNKHKTIDKKTTYNLKDSGIWGEAVRQRKPIIINDFSAPNHLKKGTPKGDVKLNNFLSIPIFADEKIVAVVGVANKKTDSNKSDIIQLTLLMNNVWKIHERHNLTEDLKKAKQKAEESDKLKSIFLANMSHEIRTPMNAIIGFTNLINNGAIEQEKQTRFLNIIDKSAKQLLKIIDDIIDISKIEANQLNISIAPFSPNELIKDVFLLFKNSKNIKKDVKLKIEFPDNSENTIIKSDSLRIKQIFINLINNALKFTIFGKIEFGYKIIENEIIFFVADTGIGIPKQKQEIIFERFRQVNEFSYHEGTGLGLAICKGIIDNLGGKIWINSEVNKGSTFYFSIKANKAQKQELVEKKDQTSLDLSGKTVFVVDDSDFSIAYLLELLQPTNANIFVLKDGVELMEELEIIIPDLILLDINMPRMTGFECIEQIIKQKIPVKVIAQTAYAMSNEKEMCINSGFDDYVSKPINEQELYTKIKKALKI